MSIATKMASVPRYGSPADVATYAGLSVKTVRRLVGSGQVPSYRVGRRVLVPFRDVDEFIQKRRAPTMSIVRHRTDPDAETRGPGVLPPGSEEGLLRRNRDAIALLDAWESEGDEQEQRETMEVLRDALGVNRAASSRNLFP